MYRLQQTIHTTHTACEQERANLEAEFLVSPKLGVDALVEVHQHSVLRVDGTVKGALHVSVCAETLLDVPLPSIP